LLVANSQIETGIAIVIEFDPDFDFDFDGIRQLCREFNFLAILSKFNHPATRNPEPETMNPEPHKQKAPR